MIIVSGLSGAGKTIALHTLEDLGYYCIDNLPINLLPALYKEQQSISSPVAVGIDIRSDTSDIKKIPTLIAQFRKNDTKTKVLFINASNEILMKRFSESRRKHPLTGDKKTPLVEAVNQERKVLSPLALSADSQIDTSKLNIYQLKDRIHHWLNISDQAHPTITIESFGFKNGVPIDADLMFDVRFLPNPYWENDIRHLNGTHPEIKMFLTQYKETNQFVSETSAYLGHWLHYYLKSNRAYLTIAIGCTGGKHRSVFISEAIKAELSKSFDPINIRHRDLGNHK